MKLFFLFLSVIVPIETLSDPGEEMGRARNAGMCPSEERGEALHHPAVFYQFLVSDINFNQLE